MTDMYIGIDEAGRGPLAGPVAVGIVMVPYTFDVTKEFPGIADSKALSEKKREELFERLALLHHKGALRYTVAFSLASTIDQVGITKAVTRALRRGIHRLAPEPRSTYILLDGLLHAPSRYKQRTIIGGDRIEPIISLASIAAKVRRDRLMRRLGKKFPVYSFELHKGYGTDLHRGAIKQFGLCAIHRKSFCHNF